MSFAKCLQLCNHHHEREVQDLLIHDPPKPLCSSAASPASCLHCVLCAFYRRSCDGITGWEAFCVWPCSLGMFFRFIHVNCMSLWLVCFYFCIVYPLFICSLWKDILFLFWGDYEKQAINIHIQIFVWTYVFISLRHISHVKCVCLTLKKAGRPSKSAGIIVHSRQQCMQLPFPPNSCQDLV